MSLIFDSLFQKFMLNEFNLDGLFQKFMLVICTVKLTWSWWSYSESEQIKFMLFMHTEINLICT
jgi:hypothetical protein